MSDDDRKEDATPDPWEGIDAEAGGELSPDIAFSFDDGLDDPAPEQGGPAGAAAGEDGMFPADDLDDGPMPMLQWDSEDDPVDGDPAADVPLAVFPPADHPDADAGAIDLEAAGDGGSGPSIGESSSVAIQSSSIQIGTGRSGIVSLDEWADAAAESVVDTGVDPGVEIPPEPVEQAAGADGSGGDSIEDFPFEDTAFDDAAQGIHGAIEDALPQESPEIDEAFGEADPTAAAADEPAAAIDPFAAAFGDLSIEPEQPADDGASNLVEPAVAAAAAPVAAAAAKGARKTAPKPLKKKAKQGGIGQMIGVVLGGLMALPITYAILVWGFQKDPFKLTKMAPPEVAFLLPQKFQPGFKRQAASLPVPSAGSSLDNLPTVPPAADAAAPEPGSDAPADGQPPAQTDQATDQATADAVLADIAGAGDAAASATNGPTVPPAPEPLDLSGLTAAVKEADAAVDALLAVEDPADPVRRKLLVGWYKTLAKVGEELTMLETVAADTGRPLQEPPAALAALHGRIAGSSQLVEDLGRLGRMWLNSQKRPADGVVLLGTFGSTRKVGPYWYTRVSLPEPEGGEQREVSIISRAEPEASEGERVVATGVLFNGDIVWAAECRRLEAAKAPVAEDLF